ncbi:Hok/Gef family protein [Kosakonia sp. BK9b]
MTPLRYLLSILLILCVSILLLTFIDRGSLWELTIKRQHQGVAEKLTCLSG